MSLVLFRRKFMRMQGGHLKVFHYYEHVRSSSRFEARIRFTSDTVWDASNPWIGLDETERELVTDELPAADVMFLGSEDWEALTPEQRDVPPCPIVNLIQYMPRAWLTGRMNKFLGQPAVRICVTSEIQEELQSTNAVRGPILTVPIGVDLERLPPPRPPEQRDLDCVVLALKHPRAGQKVAERLSAAGHSVWLVAGPVLRGDLLDAMARARVTVHLPSTFEGAYLPALESMALGAAVVCPDCVGNRSFCRDGDTCLMPKYRVRPLVEATRSLLSASPAELEPMLARGREQSSRHTLAAERERFLEILERMPELWAEV
jgi:Glycosyl transferases group 1